MSLFEWFLAFFVWLYGESIKRAGRFAVKATWVMARQNQVRLYAHNIVWMCACHIVVNWREAKLLQEATDKKLCRWLMGWRRHLDARYEKIVGPSARNASHTSPSI
jgi:hypothetical protein